MIQGTTPIHKFGVPITAAEVEKVRVTYSQHDKPVIQKETADCVVEDSMVVVKLTQEDTLKFDVKSLVSIQVRVLTKNGDALSTVPVNVSVYRCLDGGIL